MMIPDRSKSRQEDAHFRVLRLLTENPNLTQRELAEAVGISVGSVHYCLKSLAQKGAIKIRNFRNSRSKLDYAYLLTPVGLARKAELTMQFLSRKIDEYEALKLEIEILKKEVSREQRSSRKKRSGSSGR